eukprot:m51a1_g12960 hypothetical protein (239) ;mRNA; r:1506-2329
MPRAPSRTHSLVGCPQDNYRYCSGAVPDLSFTADGATVYYNPCRNLLYPPQCTRCRLCLFGPGSHQLMLTKGVYTENSGDSFQDLSQGNCSYGDLFGGRAWLICDMHNESIERLDTSILPCSATLLVRTSAPCAPNGVVENNDYSDYGKRSWWCTEKSYDVVSAELSYDGWNYVMYYSPCAPLGYWKAGPVDCSLHRVCVVNPETNTTVLRAGFAYPSSVEIMPWCTRPVLIRFSATD